MATTKTGITRRDALTLVWEFAKENGFTDTENYFDGIGETINKMITSLSTKNVPTGPSQTQIDNAETLDKHIDVIINAGDEGISAREFAVAVLPKTTDGKPAVQKATRVLLQGVNDKKLERVPQEKKSQPMRYKVAVTE